MRGAMPLILDQPVEVDEVDRMVSRLEPELEGLLSSKDVDLEIIAKLGELNS